GTCLIEPTLAFIQPHSHPSAYWLCGFHASPDPDLYRVFHNQGFTAFPPWSRFPTAHLLPFDKNGEDRG
ncbi:hypothetical protein, partial [Ferrovum myxofaciens]|uniref:hypothetical protein n=1 Tax=Ferrovum myxofaciens TaxID=416213 RepID=UPI001F2D5F0F